MLLRARGQLFSRGGGLQRESGCFLRSCSSDCALLAASACLSCAVSSLAFNSAACVSIFPLRSRKFARQCGAARALLFERLTMLLRARGQLLSRGGGLQRESGCFFALLFERSLRSWRFPLLDCASSPPSIVRRFHFPAAQPLVPCQGRAACAFLIERPTNCSVVALSSRARTAVLCRSSASARRSCSALAASSFRVAASDAPA